MAFRTLYDNYKFLVTSLRLTTVVETYVDLLNYVFYKYLNSFVIVFINDIVIYSRIRYDHEHHLRIALRTLRDM